MGPKFVGHLNNLFSKENNENSFDNLYIFNCLILFPISTKGGRLCPPYNTGTPGFSDLPKALVKIVGPI